MNSVCEYFVLFIIYSFFGWVYESTLRTILDKKWVNRGFLFGPIIPIYGVGAVVGVIITDAITLTWWQLFLIGFIFSGLLEYITGYILEKLFNAYWWDYHNIPLNINGRTDIIFDCLFGLAGLFIVYILNPFISSIVLLLNDNLIQVTSLLFMGLMVIDLTITINGLTEFNKKYIEINEKLNQRIQLRYDDVENVINEYHKMITNMPKPTLLVINKIKGLRFKADENKILNELFIHLKKVNKEILLKNKKK